MKKKSIYSAFGNIQDALWDFSTSVGKCADGIEDSDEKTNFIARIEKLRYLVLQVAPNLHNLDTVFDTSRIPRKYKV